MRFTPADQWSALGGCQIRLLSDAVWSRELSGVTWRLGDYDNKVSNRLDGGNGYMFPQGEYQLVRTSSRGGCRDTINFSNKEGSTKVQANNSSCGDIHVRVKVQSGRAPLAGVVVVADRGGEYGKVISSPTTQEGLTTLKLADGTYSLVAMKPGYRPAVLSGVVLSSAQAASKEMSMEVLRLSLSPALFQQKVSTTVRFITNWTAPAGGFEPKYTIGLYREPGATKAVDSVEVANIPPSGKVACEFKPQNAPEGKYWLRVSVRTARPSQQFDPTGKAKSSSQVYASEELPAYVFADGSEPKLSVVPEKKTIPLTPANASVNWDEPFVVEGSGASGNLSGKDWVSALWADGDLQKVYRYTWQGDGGLQLANNVARTPRQFVKGTVEGGSYTLKVELEGRTGTEECSLPSKGTYWSEASVTVVKQSLSVSPFYLVAGEKKSIKNNIEFKSSDGSSLGHEQLSWQVLGTEQKFDGAAAPQPNAAEEIELKEAGVYTLRVQAGGLEVERKFVVFPAEGLQVKISPNPAGVLVCDDERTFQQVTVRIAGTDPKTNSLLEQLLQDHEVRKEYSWAWGFGTGESSVTYIGKPTEVEATVKSTSKTKVEVDLVATLMLRGTNEPVKLGNGEVVKAQGKLEILDKVPQLGFEPMLMQEGGSASVELQYGVNTWLGGSIVSIGEVKDAKGLDASAVFRWERGKLRHVGGVNAVGGYKVTFNYSQPLANQESKTTEGIVYVLPKDLSQSDVQVKIEGGKATPASYKLDAEVVKHYEALKNLGLESLVHYVAPNGALRGKIGPE